MKTEEIIWNFSISSRGLDNFQTNLCPLIIITIDNCDTCTIQTSAYMRSRLLEDGVYFELLDPEF